MKKLAAALALSLLPLAFAAQAEITTTDVVGRKVTVPDVPKRVVLGFYYEDYLAIAGPGSLDRVVGLSLTTWKDWRPKQFAAYEKALPKLKTLPDVGSTDDNTFSIEKLIATKPDLLILATFSYEALGESVKQIEAAGIPVLVLDYLSQTVDKHVASTLALGKIMGQENAPRSWPTTTARPSRTSTPASRKPVPRRKRSISSWPRRAPPKWATPTATACGAHWSPAWVATTSPMVRSATGGRSAPSTCSPRSLT